MYRQTQFSGYRKNTSGIIPNLLWLIGTMVACGWLWNQYMRLAGKQ